MTPSDRPPRQVVDAIMGPMAVRDALAVARPSFYELSEREQCDALAEKITELGYTLRRAKGFVTQHYTPTPSQQLDLPHV